MVSTFRVGNMERLKDGSQIAVRVTFLHCQSCLLISKHYIKVFKTVAEAADRPYSYVIVTTKAIPDIIPTPSLLAPLLSPDSPYPLPSFLILQNGLFVERDLYEAIKQLGKGEPTIISTALWIGTNLLEGNVVDHTLAVRLQLSSLLNYLPI
jgi:hypothetical protein